MPYSHVFIVILLSTKPLLTTLTPKPKLSCMCGHMTSKNSFRCICFRTLGTLPSPISSAMCIVIWKCLEASRTWNLSSLALASFPSFNFICQFWMISTRNMSGYTDLGELQKGAEPCLLKGISNKKGGMRTWWYSYKMQLDVGNEPTLSQQWSSTYIS